MLPLFCLVVLYLYSNVLANEIVPVTLVNHMVLIAQWQGGRRYVNNYHYGDGDLVDASCVNLNTNRHCFAQLKYTYGGKMVDTFKSDDHLGSYLGVGFRTKLTAIHNNSQLVCTCTGYKLETITTFILRDSFDDILNMTINGLTVRGISKYSQQLNIRIQSDSVVGNGDINVQLNTYFDEVSLNWFPPSNKGLKIMDNNSRRINFTMPSAPLRFTITLANSRTKLYLGALQINFIEYPFTSSEYRWLIKNFPKENVLQEFYNYDGKQLMYYEYEEDDIMKLQCTTSSTLSGLMTVSGLEDLADSSYGNITKTMMLSSKENNAVVQCKLDRSNLILGRAFIYLRYKSPVLRVLVNRIKLTTHRDPDDNVNRSTIYKYISGDHVDLSCFKLADSCTMKLNFRHPDRVDDTFESTDLMSPNIIGFRTILHSSDDKSHIVCKCVCLNNTTTFKVTFVLQTKMNGPVGNDIELIINNRTVREIIPKQDYIIRSSKFVPLTYYSGYENIHLEAHTQRYDTTIHWSYNGPRRVIQNHFKNDNNSSISIELDTRKIRNESVDLYIYVYDKQKQLVVIKISFIIVYRYSITTLVNKVEDNRLFYIVGGILILGVSIFIIFFINCYLRRKRAASFNDNAEYVCDEFESIVLKSTNTKIIPSAPSFGGTLNSTRREEHIYEDIED